MRGPLRGFKFHVAPGMGATFALGSDAFSWRFLSQKIRKGIVVYDAGMNRGQMSLFFSHIVGEKGAVKAIDQYRPDIFIEPHGPDEQQALHHHLSGRGYQYRNMANERVKNPVVAWNSPLWCRAER